MPNKQIQSAPPLLPCTAPRSSGSWGRVAWPAAVPAASSSGKLIMQQPNNESEWWQRRCPAHTTNTKPTIIAGTLQSVSHLRWSNIEESAGLSLPAPSPLLRRHAAGAATNTHTQVFTTNRSTPPLSYINHLTDSLDWERTENPHK